MTKVKEQMRRKDNRSGINVNFKFVFHYIIV